MKKNLAILFFLFVISDLYAQKIEVSVQSYSGLFHYSGNGAASASFIHEGTLMVRITPITRMVTKTDLAMAQASRRSISVKAVL